MTVAALPVETRSSATMKSEFDPGAITAMLQILNRVFSHDRMDDEHGYTRADVNEAFDVYRESVPTWDPSLSCGIYNTMPEVIDVIGLLSGDVFLHPAEGDWEHRKLDAVTARRLREQQ